MSTIKENQKINLAHLTQGKNPTILGSRKEVFNNPQKNDWLTFDINKSLEEIKKDTEIKKLIDECPTLGQDLAILKGSTFCGRHGDSLFIAINT